MTEADKGPSAANRNDSKDEVPKGRKPRGRALPGDQPLEDEIESMIRVDHAGEYGARRIYEGQLAVLAGRPSARVIREMYRQEQEHFDTFDALLRKRRVRPTVFQPLWHVAGFVLGAGTALMGEKAAMACTVAVEEEIDRHYTRQRDRLEAVGEEGELRDTVERFRLEELEHRDIGKEHGAEEAPGYDAIYGAIRLGSRAAIWLSKRF